MDALISKSLASAGDDYATSGIYEAALPGYTPDFPPAAVDALLAAGRSRKDKVGTNGVLSACGATSALPIEVDASASLTRVAIECSQLAMQVVRGVDSPLLAVAATVLPLPAVFHFGPVETPRWHAVRKFAPKVADFGALVAVTECHVYAIPNQEGNGTRAEWAKALYGESPAMFNNNAVVPQSNIPAAHAALLEANRESAILSKLSPGEVYLCHASVPYFICGATKDAPFLAARVHFELGADAAQHLADWKTLWKAGGFADHATIFGGLCKHWMGAYQGEPMATQKAQLPTDASVFDVPPWLGHLMEAPAQQPQQTVNPKTSKMRELFAEFEKLRDALLAKDPHAWCAEWENKCRERMADPAPDDKAMRSFKNAHKTLLGKVTKMEEALPLLRAQWTAIEEASAIIEGTESATEATRAKYRMERDTIKANFADWAADPKRPKGSEFKVRVEKSFLNIPVPKKTVPLNQLRLRPIDWREGEPTPVCTLAEIQEVFANAGDACRAMMGPTAELRQRPEGAVLEASFLQIKTALKMVREEMNQFKDDPTHLYERGKCDTIIGYMDETSQAINQLKELPRAPAREEDDDDDDDSGSADEFDPANTRMSGFIGNFERDVKLRDNTRKSNCEGCADDEGTHTIYSALNRCATCCAGELKECVGHLDEFYKGSDVLVENRAKFDACYKKLRAAFETCIAKLRAGEKPDFEKLRRAVFSAADSLASLTSVEKEEEMAYASGIDDEDPFDDEEEEEDDEEEEEDDDDDDDRYDMGNLMESEESRQQRLAPKGTKGTKRSREEALLQEIVWAASYLPVMDEIHRMAVEHTDANYGNVEKSLKSLKTTPVLYALVAQDGEEAAPPTIMFRTEAKAAAERARMPNPEAFRLVALPVEERWPTIKK